MTSATMRTIDRISHLKGWSYGLAPPRTATAVVSYHAGRPVIVSTLYKNVCIFRSSRQFCYHPSLGSLHSSATKYFDSASITENDTIPENIAPSALTAAIDLSDAGGNEKKTTCFTTSARLHGKLHIRITRGPRSVLTDVQACSTQAKGHGRIRRRIEQTEWAPK